MYLCKTFQAGAFTNSVDPDETPQDAASHRGLPLFAMSSTSLVTVLYESGPLSLRKLVLNPKRGLRADDAIIYIPYQNWN